MHQVKNELVRSLSSRTATIGIFGMGYVGQPLDMRYAEVGFKVLGFDIDHEKVAALNAGQSKIEHISDLDIAAANAAGMECTTNLQNQCAFCTSFS